MSLEPMTHSEVFNHCKDDVMKLDELEKRLDVLEGRDADEYRKIKKKMRTLRANYVSLIKEMKGVSTSNEKSDLFGVYCEYRLNLSKVFERVDKEIKEAKVRAFCSLM